MAKDAKCQSLEQMWIFESSIEYWPVAEREVPGERVHENVMLTVFLWMIMDDEPNRRVHQKIERHPIPL
jgi:hypothetical protein